MPLGRVRTSAQSGGSGAGGRWGMGTGIAGGKPSLGRQGGWQAGGGHKARRPCLQRTRGMCRASSSWPTSASGDVHGTAQSGTTCSVLGWVRPDSVHLVVLLGAAMPPACCCWSCDACSHICAHSALPCPAQRCSTPARSRPPTCQGQEERQEGHQERGGGRCGRCGQGAGRCGGGSAARRGGHRPLAGEEAPPRDCCATCGQHQRVRG
jgi:hypothetical protein